MPSFLHEALLALFRNRPELAAELAQTALGLELPDVASVRAIESELTEVAPAERRADLVLDLRDRLGRTVLGFVIEVQLAIDPDKRMSWPSYLATVRARLHAPVALLVVTPDRVVARWASATIDLGPGFSLRPLVLGPRETPFADDDTIRRIPELGVLALVAHGNEPAAARMVATILGALVALDDDRARIYADLVLAAAKHERVIAAIEAVMQKIKYEYQSEFARKYYGEGRAEGIVEGRAEGIVAAIFTVLEARGIAVTEGARARITGCRDVAQLDEWLRRASVARSIDELLT